MSHGILLVGHGSRSAEGRAEVLELGTLVQRAAGTTPVDTGFLELSDPPADVALDRLIGRDVRRVVVVPLMLNSAGHAKSDVPAVVLSGRARYPEIPIAYARPLGIDTVTVALAQRRICDAGGRKTPLLVVARGTSEPEANADAARVSRLLAECTDAPFVVTGFSGLTWPSVPDALDQCVRLGADRLVVFAWYLSTGVLVQRMQGQARAWSQATGIEMIDAGHLGPDPELAPLVLARAAEALAGEATMTCDVCSYRAPFPGLEERAGTPVGVGHSHLAVEHRHHHTH